MSIKLTIYVKFRSQAKKVKCSNLNDPRFAEDTRYLSSSRDQCFSFYSRGRCRRGDKCLFLHCMNDAERVDMDVENGIITHHDRDQLSTEIEQ